MIGHVLAIAIGLSLGLLGGGGSILTVPILVYAMNMDAKLSVALSLGIVGITSLVGVYRHHQQKNVDLKTTIIFAPFAMIGTFGGAKLGQLVSGQFQLVLFAIIMLAASILMFKRPIQESDQVEKKINIPLTGIVGIFVGIITGLVGVGGGFLIVPALVLLAKLDMKKAVGTSLVIISLNSLSGFVGYLNQVKIPWDFLFSFSLLSILGIFIGVAMVKHISQQKLKKAFAVFLVIMGIFILYKNRSVFVASVSQDNTNHATMIAS